MPREIKGVRYYETSEVCKIVGISRPTLFRWLKRGILTKMHKDRRGWRLFTEDDLNKIRLQASRVDVEYASSMREALDSDVKS
ncbi:MAG: MerR family transcriptional regulator [Dehalococcoidales bacterium]|nr:MerR family transcriptional regulator [Dehalococcoidales bacterium]